MDDFGNAFGPKQNRGFGFCDPRCPYYSVEQKKMVTWDGLNDFLNIIGKTYDSFKVKTDGCPPRPTTTTPRT